MTSEVRRLALSTGVELPYVEAGGPSGVPVVLLHGLADSWRTFERVLPHLPPSVRAVVPTQRGHADASRPPGPYDPRAFAADSIALLDALGLDAAIFGAHSSHSFAAQRAAIDHPERVLGLVLIGSPAAPGRNPAVRAYWDDTVSALTDPLEEGFVREFQRSTIVEPVPDVFFDMIVGESRKVPAAVWVATFRGLLDEDVSRERSRITAPTLVLWGDRDAISPRADQDAIVSEIPGARLVVVRGAGHALHWEEPARVAAEIAAFAARVTS